MVLRDEWWAGDFAIKFDGSDQTSGLVSALAYARAASKVLRLPEGVAGCTGTLTGAETSQFAVKGAGKGLTTLEMNLGAVPLFRADGVLTAVGTLTAPVAIGATTLTLSTTSGLAKGNVLRLRDQTTGIDGDDGAGGLSGGSRAAPIASSGEDVRIRSVDSGTQVTIYGPTCWSYTTAADVRVMTSTPTGCSLSDMTLTDVSDPATGSAAGRVALLSYCADVIVRNIATRNMNAASIYLQGVNGFEVDGVDGFDSHDYETANNPYLIVAGRGSSHGRVTRCSQKYGRHLFTTASTGTEIPPQHILIANCIAAWMKQAAFDTHPGSRFITFADCYAYQCAGPGFNLRGPDQTVNNPTVVGAGWGVSLTYGADRGKVNGGKLRQCTLGIEIRDSDDIEIGGGLAIENAATNGILVTTPAAAWAGRMTKMNVDDTRITGTPSDAGVRFQSGAWNAGFRLGSKLRIPDATTKIAGTTTPSVSAAATITVPA